MATYVVRTLKSGLKKVKVMVRRKNAPSLTQTFPTRREAEAWAMSIEGELLTMASSPRVEAARHTVAEAIQRYKEVELARKVRKHKDQTAQLDWWSKELGHLPLAKLTGPVICQCRDKLASGTTVHGKPRQPATVNRYLAAFSHVLSVAERDWGWLADSPMRRVRKLREPRGRVRYLSQDELAALLTAVTASKDPHLKLAVLMALATGMRRGEIVGLRWADVDWKRRRLILEHTKNGDRRAVPLPTKVFEQLEDRFKALARPNPLVFPSVKAGFESKTWDFERAWRRALRDAQITDFRFHDLRHSCASYLAMNGATTVEIADVLGHKTLAMVRRYAHLADTHVAALVSGLPNKRCEWRVKMSIPLTEIPIEMKRAYHWFFYQEKGALFGFGSFGEDMTDDDLDRLKIEFMDQKEKGKKWPSYRLGYRIGPDHLLPPRWEQPPFFEDDVSAVTVARVEREPLNSNSKFNIAMHLAGESKRSAEAREFWSLVSDQRKTATQCRAFVSLAHAALVTPGATFAAQREKRLQEIEDRLKELQRLLLRSADFSLAQLLAAIRRASLAGL